MTNPVPPKRPTEDDLRRHKLEMIWEVLARVGADPARAVWYMAEYQREAYTQAEAQAELDAAKGRNRLRLVDPYGIRSSCARRLRPHGRRSY